MNIVSDERQSIFDLALIGAGTAEAAFDIAYKNGRSISSTLHSGTSISVNAITSKKATEFFVAHRKPCTIDIVRKQIFDITFDPTFEIRPLITRS